MLGVCLAPVAAVVLLTALALATFAITFMTSSVQPVGLRPHYAVDVSGLHLQPLAQEHAQRDDVSLTAGDAKGRLQKSDALRAWRSDKSYHGPGTRDASVDPWAHELQKAGDNGVEDALDKPAQRVHGSDAASQPETFRDRQQRARAPSSGVLTQHAQHNGTVAVPFMLIGVPTVHRPNSPDYLQRTLNFLSAQIVEDALSIPGDSNIMGPYPMRVHVMIVNNMRPPEQHVSWMAERDAACSASGAPAVPLRSMSKLGRCAVYHAQEFTVFSTPLSPFTFVVNKRPVVDDGSDAGDANHPGARVRRQTRDVVSLLEVAVALHGNDDQTMAFRRNSMQTAQPAAGEAQYFLFMEDDFRMCPSALEALAYLVRKAEFMAPDWNAVRVSLGLNGALLRMADIPVLSAYMMTHISRRPPDHLLVEWFAGETPTSAAHKRGRPHAAFRYNVLEHFGFHSSLRNEKSPIYAYCYDKLTAPVVFEVEQWREHECGHDDVWPCRRTAEAAGYPVPSTTLDFERLQRAARESSAQTWKPA